MKEVLYSPHYDFFIEMASRQAGYDMKTFHIHKKYEIYYQAKGTRRYYIEDATYLVNEGDIVLIGPDSVHKTASVENMPHVRYVMNFSQGYLGGLQEAFPDADLLSCFGQGIHILSLSPKMQILIESRLKVLWDNREGTSPQAVAMRKLMLAALLLELDRLACGAVASGAQQNMLVNPTIENIIAYLTVHYHEHLTLSAIASQFYISPHYLSRLFKKITGLSIVEYINSIRIKAAASLLEHTELPVSQISERCGFSTTTHFCRVFKSGTGLAPQKYRKYYKDVTGEPVQ